MKGDTMAASPETVGHGLELGPDGKPVKGAALKFYREEAKRVTAQLNTPTPPALGRPTIYSPELADKICQQIAEGKSLISITRQDGMPEPGSVYNWLRKYPDFLHKYSIARQDAADTLADEILRISDELEHATDPIQIQAARLRVESRRWIASRLKPQTWGDKVQAEITGADGAPLPLVTVQFVQPGAKQVEGEVIEGELSPPSGMKG